MIGGWAVSAICLSVPLLAALLIITAKFVLVVVTVENKSMSPTYEHGDRVLVVRHWPRKLIRRDLIAIVWPWELHPAGRGPFVVDHPFIKRVVGVAGDTITASITELDDFNRRHQEVFFDASGWRTWHVPTGHCFVRGDNAIGGIDSLSWGPIPLQSILGVVIMKLPRKAK